MISFLKLRQRVRATQNLAKKTRVKSPSVQSIVAASTQKPTVQNTQPVVINSNGIKRRINPFQKKVQNPCCCQTRQRNRAALLAGSKSVKPGNRRGFKLKK